jgi:hypothetical protein
VTSTTDLSPSRMELNKVVGTSSKESMLIISIDDQRFHRCPRTLEHAFAYGSANGADVVVHLRGAAGLPSRRPS